MKYLFAVDIMGVAECAVFIVRYPLKCLEMQAAAAVSCSAAACGD